MLAFILHDLNGHLLWVGHPHHSLTRSPVIIGACEITPPIGDWSGGSSAPLWYAHYDGSASFGDFVPFGGWGIITLSTTARIGGLC
jgi:hypothetical protein